MRGEDGLLARMRRQQFCRIARRCQAATPGDLSGDAVVLAPHYDDETLGAGGTILIRQALGARTHLVFLTNGAASHAQFLSPTDLAAMRRAEGDAAAVCLGIPPADVHSFEFPDGRLAEFAGDAAEKLARLLVVVGATTMFVPWRDDGHSDHDVTFTIGRSSLGMAGLAGALWEYPIWAWDVWPWMACPPALPLNRERVRTHRRYWRRSALAARGFTSGRSFTHSVDIRPVLAQKRRALAAHRSQVERQQPGWPVLADVGRGTFLPRFFNDCEVFRRTPVFARPSSGKGQVQ